MNKPNDKPNPPHDLHAALREAMLDLGWIPPTTEQEFAELEAQLEAAPPELPPELTAIKDPTEAPRFSQEAVPTIIPFPQTEVQQNLARAACRGGQISPDIQARMRQDRTEAEGKTDGR